MTELSDKPFANVEEVVKEGDRVKVRVVKIDPEQNKIALSLLTGDNTKDDIVLNNPK